MVRRAWAVVLCGCGSQVFEEDTGNVCFLWEADDVPLAVSVDYGCVPCGSEDLEVSCEASFDGVDTITVSSTLSYGVHPVGACAEICRPLAASCALDPLPAGTYTVVHGERTMSVTLAPSDVPTCP